MGKKNKNWEVERLRNNGTLEDLSVFAHGFEAFHTDLDLFGCTIYNRFYSADIGVENPLIYVMSMRDSVTSLWMFAAYFASLGHNSSRRINQK